MTTIATHDGIFHADDVFAAAALMEAYGGVVVKRTRNPRELAQADIVFDVGNDAYDHHQPGGNGQRDNGVPYASFGLIWRDFGNSAVAAVVGNSMDTDWYLRVAEEVDRMLVQPIDAADNGISLHDGKPKFDGIRGASVSSLIAWMNPAYGADDSPQALDRAFMQAVEFARGILRNAVIQAAGIVDAAADMARAINAMDRRGDRIIVLDAYVPDWQRQAVASEMALYIVYPSGGSWRCQTVPNTYALPGSRHALPEAWAGLNGADLQAATGVEDATFCHRGRFIAGAQSKDGAIRLAQLALPVLETTR